MTDDLFEDDGAFGDGFFSSLAASPDDPASVYDSDAALDEGAEDDYHFLYESEGDGSFETDAEGFDDESFNDEPYDYDFDPGSDAVAETDAEIDPEPDFDPDHDFDHEDDHEFGPDLGRGFGPGL